MKKQIITEYEYILFGIDKNKERIDLVEKRYEEAYSKYLQSKNPDNIKALRNVSSKRILCIPSKTLKIHATYFDEKEGLFY